MSSGNFDWEFIPPGGGVFSVLSHEEALDMQKLFDGKGTVRKNVIPDLSGTLVPRKTGKKPAPKSPAQRRPARSKPPQSTVRSRGAVAASSHHHGALVAGGLYRTLELGQGLLSSATVRMTAAAASAVPRADIDRCVERAIDTGATETVNYRGHTYERAFCQGRGSARQKKLWILMELADDVGTVNAFVGLPTEFKGTRKI